MKLFTFFPLFLIIIFSFPDLKGNPLSEFHTVFFLSGQPDTLKENQILYNGIIWRNLYSNIKEDPYLFSKDFLPGSVTINNETFKNVNLRYDIYNDELMTPTNRGSIVKLNKEMVDSFSLNFENKTYRFINISKDSLNSYNGYFNVLYSGKTALMVKYKKEIELLAVDKKYDLFFQTHKVLFMSSNIIYTVTGKADLEKILNDKKVQIKAFIKSNKLKISRKRPESFVPVVRFYDSISK